MTWFMWVLCVDVCDVSVYMQCKCIHLSCSFLSFNSIDTELCREVWKDLLENVHPNSLISTLGNTYSNGIVLVIL